MRCCFLLLAFVVPSGLVAQEATKEIEVEKHLNLVYNPAKDADPVRHKLDIYTPKGMKNFPVMLFVHGGTWQSGSKDLYAGLGQTFAKQGIGTVIINYRLSKRDGNVKHPDHIQDVAKAFAWTKENISKYGGNKERLFISGHSAGGHLVALLTTDEQYLKAEKCTPKDIHGVLALSGVYEIVALVPVFHNAFGKDDAVCKAASPINHVKKDLPPFLVAYADKDLPTLDLMAEQFGKKLQENQCDCKVLKLEQRDHISIIINTAANKDDPLAKAMIDFINKRK
jgi:acetyl esterase/lipase